MKNSLTRTKHTKQHDDTLLLLLSCHAAVSAAWWLLNVVKSYMGTPHPCLVYLGTCYFRHRWNKPEELSVFCSLPGCAMVDRTVGEQNSVWVIPAQAPVNRENNSNLGGFQILTGTE
jgi:hypothetical protein